MQDEVTHASVTQAVENLGIQSNGTDGSDDLERRVMPQLPHQFNAAVLKVGSHCDGIDNRKC